MEAPGGRAETAQGGASGQDAETSNVEGGRSGHGGERSVAGGAGTTAVWGGAAGLAAGTSGQGGDPGVLTAGATTAGGKGSSAGVADAIPQGGKGGGCAEGEACAGYTLMGVPENVAGYNFPTSLVDMDGTVVHTWTIPGYPPKMLPGGALIGCVSVFPTSYDCVEVQQVSEPSLNGLSRSALFVPSDWP